MDPLGSPTGPRRLRRGRRRLSSPGGRLRLSMLVAGLIVAAGRWHSPVVGHEGHQPLPTRGIELNLAEGRLTLSRGARRILALQTVPVSEGTVESVTRAYATVVTPWTQHAFVTARLPGRVVALRVRPGDLVEAGQVLAEVESLDLQQLQLDYQEALNQFALATQLLESMQATARTGAIPRQRLLEAETAQRQQANTIAILSAKARLLGLAPDRLSATVDPATPLRLPLIAPLSGQITHADVSLGESVEPTQHLLELVATPRVWIQVGVLEGDLARVTPGQSARLKFPGVPGRVLTGRIDRLSPRLDPVTHQGTAWIDLPNPADEPALVPGMTGVAEVLNRAGPSRITVPVAAVFSDGAERFLLVEATSTRESSEFRKVPVALGQRSRHRVEIVAGDVYPGDRVVTQGGHELATLFFSGVLRLSAETSRAIGLRVEAVRPESVETGLEVEGQVDIPPTHRTLAATRLPGTIARIHVDRGQPVQQGDLLAEVDSLEFHDLQLDLLRTNLEAGLGRATLARLESATDAVSRRQILEATTRLRGSEARQRSLAERLTSLGVTEPVLRTLLDSGEPVQALPIRAASDGVVVDFDRVLGQVVQPNQPIFEVHDVTQGWIQVVVTEREATQVRVGQPARVRLVAQPGRVLEGEVRRLAPTVDPVTRLRTLWVECRLPDGVTLQHNQLARVMLTTSRPAAVLAVPREAVVRDGLRSFVFLQREDGSFERRPIEAGPANDLFVGVTGGLHPGDRIATRGATELQQAFSALR